MTKETKKAIKEAVDPIRDFVKLANKLVSSQFNEGVKQEAKEAASSLVEAGVLHPTNEDEAAKRLALKKKASFDGLKKLARYVQLESTDIGVAKESGTEKSAKVKKSEQIWRSGFNLPN